MFGQGLAMMSRFVALLIGTLALASLRGHFDGMADGSAGEKLWLMAGYFTFLTNLGLAAMMFAVARGWRMPGGVAVALVVSTVMVGAVYHLLLAGLSHPVGPAWWANQGLHSAVPAAVVLWWWVFADKSAGWSDVGLALVWPGIYCGYALVRGYVTGFWPYPFLNGETLGVWRLGMNVLGLMAAFAGLAAAMVRVARSAGQAVLIK
jgi:hypothetical protein